MYINARQSVQLLLLVLFVHEGNCACTKPTAANGCVTCADTNNDGEISTGETCTVQCSNGQPPDQATANCEASGSFTDTLACPAATGTPECTDLTVTNGCLACTDSVADGNVPSETDTCEVICDDGYGQNEATVTCTSSALTPVPTCTVCEGDNCQRCAADPAVCTFCDAGYGVDSSDRCAACDVSNCATCPTDIAVCTTCNDGHRLASATSCEACMVSNCKTCPDAAANCVTCNDGFELNNDNECITCTDPNCQSCPSAPATCEACNDGYRVQDNACQACSVGNCRSCPTDAAACETCTDGHRVQDAACQACTTGCATCTTDATQDDNEVCQTCSDGYTLSDGVCNQDSGASSNVISAQIILLVVAGYLYEFYDA